jgi:putative ABC transport system permease protein
MLKDVRLAFRSFRQHPDFSALAVLIVALGAGANASVFSVIQAVLIEPLPYTRPDELISILPDGFVSNGDIDFLRSRTRSFVQIASSSPGWTMSLLGAGDPQRVTATKTSANVFDMLGVRPMLGRTFAADEDLPGRNRVAILSHGLWQSTFGGNASAVGRIVTLEGAPHEIVGVMGSDFELLGREAELWMPLPFDRTSPFWKGTVAQAIGRTREGVDLPTAVRELQALVPAWRRELGYEQDWGQGSLAVPLRQVVVGDVRQPLLVLAGAVGLIVMLTAANLGTLLLGRHVARRREMAVRGALGASAWRLIRQSATESLVLAIAGAATGLLLARLALPALVRLLPPEMPRVAAIDIEPVVLAVVVGASIVSVLGFGALPSLITVRPSLQPLLRLGAQSETRGGRRALHLLVVGQVALAIVLGAGAALMGRSMLALQSVHPGFEPAQVLTLKLQPSGDRVSGVDRAVQYYGQMLSRVAQVPGVAHVAAVNHLPLSGYNWTSNVRLDERPLPPGVTPPAIGWRMIQGRYFDAMQIPVIAGRVFDERDTRQSPAVVIVNEVFAKQFFGSAAGAVGRRLRTGSARGEETPVIVGVVGGVRHASLSREPAPEMYRPVSQNFSTALALVVRTSGAPAGAIASVRRAVWEVDPTVPIADIMPLTTLLRESLGRPRLLATLLLVFASVGLLIVLSGVYGVVAYSVRRREREMGIRLALGAAPLSVGGMVVRQGVLYAVSGLALGIPAALALTGFMRSQLFGVQPRDPATIAGLCGMVAAATIAATLVPALRAQRVDPMAVLRSE